MANLLGNFWFFSYFWYVFNNYYKGCIILFRFENYILDLDVYSGNNGCQIVYDFLISKVMKSIEQIIDIFFEEYKEMRVELVKNAKSCGEKIVKNIKKIAEKMKNKQIEKVPTNPQ